jgi:glutamate synthase (NADPH/NADH) small chain
MADVFTELHRPLSEQEARVEADRCLECGSAHAQAPCLLACPAGVDVPRFVAAIARGDDDEAAATIFEANLLGATCARVCPVEVLCQGACLLDHEGRRPIEIGALQRYAMDLAHARGLRTRRPLPATGRRVAVVGAGPAGLACAGELALLGHSVMVFDAREEPGGLVRYAIAPYRQLNEPLPDEAELVRDLGVDLMLGLELTSPADLRALEDEFDAIVLGVGLGTDTDGGYEGSDLGGVWRSLEFVETLKAGAPPPVGRRAVVVGGGNTAMDCAIEARRLGAEQVTVLYRRTEPEMPAYPHEVELARAEGVEFRWLTTPVRFVGEDRVELVECRSLELGEPDESGRRRPVEVPGSEFTLEADTAIVAIGQQPRRNLFEWIDGLELDGSRLVVDPETGRTGNPKYFAAGDAVNGGATVVEAVAGAKRAAAAIDAQLRAGSEVAA